LLGVNCCHPLCDVSTLKGKKEENERSAGGVERVWGVSSTVKTDRLM